jgi:hypothetical protein
MPPFKRRSVAPSLVPARIAASGRNQGTNWLLALLGIALLILAGAGFLLGKSWELVGGFLGVGAVLVIVSVLMAFMEGTQKIELPGGVKIEVNLATFRRLEDRIAAGDLEELSEED